jgi:hypothetical protein
MQAAPLFPDSRLEEIHRRLLAFYGQPPARDVWDPLKQFIYSLLSSRTKTEVSHQVVQHLQARFGSWENLRDASVTEIEDAIRAVTFPERKAVQLKQALQQITQRCGTLSLDVATAPIKFVCGWNVSKASASKPALPSSTSAHCVAAPCAWTATTCASPSVSVLSHRVRMPARPKDGLWRWLLQIGRRRCWTSTTRSSKSTASSAAPSPIRNAPRAHCSIFVRQERVLRLCRQTKKVP